MGMLCRLCSRANPSEARYCHFDGSFLQSSQVCGPQDVAHTPFAEPFHFPTGEVCQNFDQLALTCHMRWHDTWELLQNGALQAFLATLGRMDLINTAGLASAELDPDRGVDYFLARLPARNLSEPCLRVAPDNYDLGILKPGQDLEFDLRLSNDGHRLIVGAVTTDCAWLQLQGAVPGQPRMIQFSHEQTVRVRVLGNKLSTGHQPRVGKLVAATNAGSAEIVVSCNVPIVPFPDGVLQGCQSPRDVAVRAKRALHEAGELFFQGKVQAWYQANGWTYPVVGEPASGKAAVQQFFEALGLTKPPRVFLDTPAVTLQGPPGKRIRQTVYFHTNDNRPIFVFGRSLTPWLNVVDHSAFGIRASVTIEVHIPTASLYNMEHLETQLEVRANGNQCFRVPIVLHIDAGGISDGALDHAGIGVESVTPSAISPPPEQRRSGCSGYTIMAALVAALLTTLCISAATTFLFLRQGALTSSPLEPYAAAVSPQTYAALAVNLAALGQAPGLEKESRQLQEAIVRLIRDLDLQTPDSQPRGIFVSVARNEPPLTVLTFASHVQFGKVISGRYDLQPDKARCLCVDRLDPGLVWAIDAQGRLIGGPPEAVGATLEREKNGQRCGTYYSLATAATGISTDALAWVAGNFDSVGAAALNELLGHDSPPPCLKYYRLELVAEPQKGFVLRGQGAFPSRGDAGAWREAVVALPNDMIPPLRGTVDLSNLVLGAAMWEHQGSDLRMEVALKRQTIATVLHTAVMEVSNATDRAMAGADKLCRTQCDPGHAAMKSGNYVKAVEVFERVAVAFPNHHEPRVLVKSARQSLAERQAYDAGLKAARDALASGNFPAARAATNRAKKSRFADHTLTMLEKELQGQETLAQFRSALRDAQALVSSGDLDKASAAYKRACALNSADPVAAGEFAAVRALVTLRNALQRADKYLQDERPDAARKELVGALLQLESAASAVWGQGSFKLQRARFLKQGTTTCRRVYDTLKDASDKACERANALVHQQQFIGAEEEYNNAEHYLKDANVMLNELQQLGGATASLSAELRAVDQKADALRKARQSILGKSLMAKGKQGLEQATLAYKRARSEPTVVRPALAVLDEALKQFRDAAQLGEKEATINVRAVEGLRHKLAPILRPVVLDLGLDQDPAQDHWSYQKDQWTLRVEGTGKRWLQAKADDVMLHAPSRDWPVEFEVAMDVALVDVGGRIRNASWAYHADPVRIVLQDRSGEITTVALGKDTGILLQPVTRLRVNKQDHVVENSLSETEPIHLGVRCTRRTQDDRLILEVSLNKRSIALANMTDGLQSVKLRVVNPAQKANPRFVAVFRLDAFWAGAKRANGSKAATNGNSSGS